MRQYIVRNQLVAYTCPTDYVRGDGNEEENKATDDEGFIFLSISVVIAYIYMSTIARIM